MILYINNSNSCPLVSIIIVNYDGQQYFEHCLESVFRSNYESFEVILVDNSSSDNSVEIASRFQDRRQHLTIVRNPCNLGFANGNNIGIKMAEGKYVAILNSDTEVHPSWLTALVKVMEGDSTVGPAQSNYCYLNAKLTIQLEILLIILDLVLLGAEIGERQMKVNTMKFRRFLVLRGASMITRQSVLGEVGITRATA
jgi:GT2 family glycosyltransferase